ncbi:MAG: hypothetical protein AAFZ07_25605 [Actinomycetota bacterium]
MLLADEAVVVSPWTDVGGLAADLGMLHELHGGPVFCTHVGELPAVELSGVPAVYCDPSIAYQISSKDRLYDLLDGIVELPQRVDYGDLRPGPWVVKPDRGSGSAGLFRTSSELLVDAALSDDYLVVQREIRGRSEWDAVCFVDAGELVGAVVTVFDRMRGGIGTRWLTIPPDPVLPTLADIAVHLGLHGIVNMHGWLGDPIILCEINPRPSTGIEIAQHAGVDCLELYENWCDGVTPSRRDILNYRSGVRVERHFTSITRSS